MKKFFSHTLAATLGVFVAIILLAILSSVALVSTLAVASAGDNATYAVKPHTLLHLKLKGTMPERSQESDPYALLMRGEFTQEVGLDQTLAAIRLAATNDNITGIYLEAAGLQTGYATLNSLHDALLTFKESGKPIIAYADNYMQQEYYLASVADTVVMNPVGMLDFRGLSANPIFYAKAMEKLGIEMQVFKVGSYKSAVEPYLLTSMSEPSREQTQVFLDNIWDNLVEGIAQSRGVSPQQLNRYADQVMLTQPADSCVSYGLIDTLMYRTEVEELLARLTHVERASKLKLATVKQMVSTQKSQKSEPKEQIAILYAVGEIDGVDPNSGINTKKLVKELTRLTHDEAVKGVVLRVNSPGGSAFGSEQVWYAVEQLKAVKPVAVSMGDYAASGGYYISAPANRIFAHPTTLTGSIGIFGTIPNAEKLLTDKIGLSFDEVRTNKHGNFPSFSAPMSASEKAMMQGYVERGYALFLARCAEGRHLPTPEIATVAEGRVWSGEMALQLHLIDELGSLADATAWVAQEAGVEQYSEVIYPKAKSMLEQLVEGLEGGSTTLLAKQLLGDNYPYYKALEAIQTIDPIQARMESVVIE